MYDNHMNARRTAQWSAAVLIVGAVGLGFVPYFGGTEGDPDRLRYALSFAAVYAVPALIGWLGIRRGTPRYTMAVAWALLPLSILSIVLIPFIIPALIMGVAAARLIRPGPAARIEVPVAIVVGVGPILAMAALLTNQEWVEYQTATGSGAGDQTTISGYLQAWVCLAIVLAVSFVRGPRTASPDAPARRHRAPSDLPA